MTKRNIDIKHLKEIYDDEQKDGNYENKLTLEEFVDTIEEKIEDMIREGEF